jgi:TPR repeat protein
MTLALEKAPPAVDDTEQQAWAAIQQAVVPAERVKLLQQFIAEFKDSRFLQAARTQLERAVLSEAATRVNAVQIDAGIGDAQFREDQRKGLDGDKDAAYRVALAFRDGSHGAPRDERKMIQWLRHASELKNGIASYTLYVHYRDRQMDRDAVRYENAAVAQGYTLPARVASGR